jgi:hypothetical protein
VHVSQISVAAVESAFVSNVRCEEQRTCTLRAPAKLDGDDERDRPECDLTHLVSDGTTFQSSGAVTVSVSQSSRCLF